MVTHPNRLKSPTRATLAAALVLSLAPLSLRAQAPADAPATAATTGTNEGPITKLAAVNVNEVPIAQQVLPTVRPVGDVMGDDANILDVPRSVSSVNKAWMQDRQVRNAMDFGQFSPGVYSAAQYGIPAVPFIRGDLSQIYVNGQLAIFSRNSTPPSFNGVESLDIVKGPGSAIYGPQGEGAGGYVDFVMKEPYFDRNHFNVDVTLDGLASGHSYFNPEFTIDGGGPLSDKLAYRISYLSRYGEGYYKNFHNETQDGYFALTYLPTPALKFEFWTQLYSDRTNENTGANRVTQQFIWNGRYIGGPASPSTSGPTAYYGYDIFTTPTPAEGTFPSTADGSYSVVNPSTAYNVKLPAYDALIGPSDTARSKLFQVQLKSTLELSADSRLVNLTYFANGNSNKFETYGYDEFVPKQQTAQDRLEFHDKFTLGGMENDLITGADFRFSALTSYQDFATEPFTYYDLYQPLSKIYYPGYAYEGKTWGGGLQIPGAPGYSAYSGTSGNQISHIYDSALFFQDNIKLLPQLSLIPGYRMDYIDADTANPSFVQTGFYDSYYDYIPLATPLYIPKGGSSPYYTGFKVHDTKMDQSYFLSTVYKLSDTTSVYATYDKVQAILGSSNFGGLDVSSGGGKASLDKSLGAASTLYEVGYKESFLHNTLYFSAAAFQQLKLGVQLGGATYKIKDNGLELDAVYQPNQRWTFNANFTMQDATAFGGYYFQESGNYLDGYTTATAVDGTHGTGIGAPNFSYTLVQPGKFRMRAPGIPQTQANGFVEYKDPMGWGVGAGPQIQGRMYANDQDTLHIPGEVEWDGYVFYGTKQWDVRVNVKNLTNARLIDPIDVSFAGNDTIYVRPPISASVTFRYHY